MDEIESTVQSFISGSGLKNVQRKEVEVSGVATSPTYLIADAAT